ncbi:hypothetical protein OSS47_04270 [Pseudomonas citronellolis]|uniref:hypothetical protein n=1 Tax=Pseudomonas citronellolis TaxID=53408 RepID=UPI00227037F4|nr:hypothetical protein [Pseudomonas citronellolis]WAB93203.1 hypothetical protein OSS47_04270 [Pseudomonas citronellolis]
MNFVGCDGVWITSQGSLTCSGTLYTYTADEMAQLLGSGLSAVSGLTLEQLIGYGVVYGLSYWAIFFLFKQVQKALG